jgi:hypothetical protein
VTTQDQDGNHTYNSYLPGLVTFVAPLIIVLLVGCALWHLLPSQWFETRTLSTLDTSKLDGFARAIDGRMTFSIMSVAVWCAAAVALALSCLVVHRALWPRAVLIALAIAAGTAFIFAKVVEGTPSGTTCQQSYESGTVFTNHKQGFRVIVIDNVMCVAESRHAPEMRVLAKTQCMIIFNTYVGFLGAAAVMVAFGALAMRYGPRWSDPSHLRRRLDDFRTMTIMAGVLFVLTALVTKSLVSWTQGLLANDSDAASFARLGSALLNYWAAETSVILLATVSFAAVFIQWDIAKAAATAAQASNGSVRNVIINGAVVETRSGGGGISEAQWKKDNELIFDSTTVTTATIGIIAPLLAGPAVDLVTRALH